MARNLSVILILTFTLSVTNPLHELEPATAFAQTTEKIITNWESGINVDLAVATQRHHLQQLFHRYGENNSLSVEGFRKLLQNIGIDKVKKIHIHHDHDHHSDHEHHSHRNHAASSKNNRKALCPDHESDSSGKDPRNSQGKGSHRSERANGRRNVLIKDDVTASEVTSTVYNAVSEGTHFLETIDTPKPGKFFPKDVSSSTPPSITEKSRVSRLASRKTNESVSEPRKGFMYSRNANENTQECFNASKLLTSHGMGIQVLLNATEFNYLCPAIINQIDARSCLIHTTSEKKAEIPPKTYSLQIAWVGGFIAISIISFLSLLGVILVPLMNRVFFKFLLSFLVALAVGTLSGDAFLHLLPHSHASHHHSHSHEESAMEMKRGPLFSHLSSQNIEESTYFDSTWKGLTALGGLYFMFLVEHVLTLIKQFKDKKKKNQKKPETDDDVEIKKQLSKYESQLSTNEEKADADDRPEGYLRTDSQEPSHFDSQQPAILEEEEVMIAHAHPQEVYNEYVPRGCKNKCHSHFHDTLGQSDDLIHHHHDYHHILHHHHHQNHHPHSHSQRYSREELKDAGIATLAWMVIMGDGLHNFSDGLAIGAAFTEGLSSGLSTSVAVFCHELPHELGDFAVLLKAGMTVKQAVLYNALSAMLAYLGMATGIFIGHYAENVSMWIFALTAGLFMYVALVDMVPEMLHNDASDHGCSRWGYFFLQNAGILLGFGIMLLISIFEHKIVFRINF
ncbi:zinc transporter ZIP6 [Zalophus californianus]|uniref:Zinc transporter ZIP6 n=2 Tax=Otariidae TaxID=9702 RepID=A0A6J2BJR4_ZALCA|nr:zinc transporter ZIP6 [Zalophus californianus]XP_027431232.1 zinc transporter ZIP6 [Zalophus californianus]XP_027431234.1 zinc transporter ZIP6 [Zalophus californianus]XP_027431235.1 zinc transporter ZIP6 [Zalophus californianus]XP_027954176.1 zinc transporter ZIP6 isoform X2 [Eumetopias jubatus]XP_027954177.1 zinc transporter ZIP6 isoform X2 [Eumetopias jubatus]XP_027954178.1 zinc transporter ZIP6 isoform X2 [Eumetopias jubatus]XP_027954179.1 zinc transporter ZIP6 isoform X2 [Eumetopias 